MSKVQSVDEAQKPPSFGEVANMIDNSSERICNRMNDVIQGVASSFNTQIENNGDYVLRKVQVSMQEVYEKIEVLTEAVFPPTGKVAEETTITPDSEDVHEIRGVEYVGQPESEVGKKTVEVVVPKPSGHVVQSKVPVAVEPSAKSDREIPDFDPSVFKSNFNS